MSSGALVVADNDLGSEHEPEHTSLPPGWAWAKLREVGIWGSGGTPASNNSDFYDGNIPWYRITDLNGGRLPRPEKTISKLGLSSSSARLIEPPFLLLAMYGASIGKTGISTIQAATNQAIAWCRPHHDIDLDFLHFYLRHIQRSLVDQGQGGAQPNVSRSIVLDQPIPLAPAAEQHRIVARIDELFAEIAEGEAALQRARQGLDTWRRALLKAAVTGELTRNWREANCPTETGADLLACIRAELGGLAAETIPATHELQAVFKKPKGWEWARIGDLTEAIDYGTSDKCATDPVGVPVLRMGNIQDGNLDISRLKYADPTQIKNLPLLERGDILFNRTNSAELVGKTAIYRGFPAPCSFASYLIRIRVALCEPDFVAYWLNSVFGKSWVANNKSQQVGQANLSGGKLKRMPIPLPPLLEQKEIVRRVREQFDVGDTSALTIGQVDRDRAALRQAILKGAFEGRLVPQDPADEPASALVARLRNGHPGAGARRRKTRAAADFSHPSLPGLIRQSVDPRVEPAGDE